MAIFALLSYLAAGGSQAQAANTTALKNPHGSTEGLATSSPEWSLGAQIGSYGATGIAAQKAGFYDGALNLGLGLSGGSLSLAGDYIRFLNDDFHLLTLPESGYNAFRGQVTPYFGGGVQVGSGAWIRLPVGVQYGMLRDPFNFYGGVILMLGHFYSDDDIGPQLWINVGARVLL